MDLSEISTNTNRHPWEMSRAQFLLRVICSHKKLTAQSELLDIGAGDLFFSEKIHGSTSVKIDAVDNAFENDETKFEAIKKIRELDEVLHKKYDAICALDVLEHIENDRPFVHSLVRLMKVNSVMILTVPAFQFLFTEHDHNLRHFRRYSYGNLKKTLPSNVEVIESFYFFHSLFFARLFQKIKNRKTHSIKTQNEFKSINKWGFAEHHPITKSLGTMLSVDALMCRFLSKFKIRLPGLSLCMVIRKKPNNP